MKDYRVDQKILDQLSENFTRQELLKATLTAGYSMSKANQLIERGVILGKIKRVDRGQFQKA